MIIRLPARERVNGCILCYSHCRDESRVRNLDGLDRMVRILVDGGTLEQSFSEAAVGRP